jgi:hypothetical protein
MNRNVFPENAPSLRFYVLSFPWIMLVRRILRSDFSVRWILRSTPVRPVYTMELVRRICRFYLRRVDTMVYTMELVRRIL